MGTVRAGRLGVIWGRTEQGCYWRADRALRDALDGWKVC